VNLELDDRQSAFQREVAAFAAETVAPRAQAIDETNQFPRDLVKPLAGLGLFGVTIPRERGGAGRDYVSYALALEALARASAVVSVIASVNNSLVAEPVAKFGSESQKETWLRRLASGEMLGAFALSEAQAGSDAANQQTVARLDAPGVTRVAAADSLGVRGLGCVDLALDDVHVGADALLGGPGDGFHVAMWALDGGRVAIAAQALGVGQAALDAALAHAKQHEAFGQPIANYQAIQWMLADSATELDAARMLMLKAADARTRTDRPTLEAAMAKLSASEAAHHAADRAMQILASHGYRRGSVVERLFRDVRATEIYQGTSEAQRMIIAANVLANA